MTVVGRERATLRPMTMQRPGGLIEEVLTGSIIGAFYTVYRELGFGFLEPIHAAALEIELRERGHDVARQFGTVVRYKGVEIAHQRLDMVVDNKVIVEITSAETLHRLATRQVLNYLRATSFEVGLLLHFGREANFYRVVCENGRPAIRRPAESLVDMMINAQTTWIGGSASDDMSDIDFALSTDDELGLED
jgi:GxxExxY protein